MTDLIQISYTGDILAHRRCSRAWAYEKYAQFHPYEQVQAMEGRLVHHAMEWMTRRHLDTRSHVTAPELRTQLNGYFSILWARGVKTAFTSKAETLDRVLSHIFPDGVMHPTVRIVIEGAQHTEYEIRAVRKVLPSRHHGKSKILLTGVVDLVVQTDEPIVYARSWGWDDLTTMEGQATESVIAAHPGEVEIWDYKATRARSRFLADYVRQVVTYAALYKERSGELPARGVLFFLNEPDPTRQLLAVEVTQSLVDAAINWTEEQIAHLQATIEAFETMPTAVLGGDFTAPLSRPELRVNDELLTQCTGCSLRFDCSVYRARIGSGHRDLDLLDVTKN